MKHMCYFCHVKTVEKLIKKFQPSEAVADEFVQATQALLFHSKEKDNPELAMKLHRLGKRFFQNNDLFIKEKDAANSLLMDTYSYWKKMVATADRPLYAAAKLAVIGNIIDYGAHSVQEDIIAQINAFIAQDLKVDMRTELEMELEKAKSVLYLGDNCGELVFDKLFIETIQHPNLTYAVRGFPVINDVTMDDARKVGMDRVCRLLSNGADAPATILDRSSPEFRAAFEKADLIISKGQGNFEGLMGTERSNIFFLLIAKCNPMATMLGVNKNDMVVKRLLPSLS